MDLLEFKNKLDSREFWGVDSNEMWKAANKWQDLANKENESKAVKWRWGCGLKLDFDGTVCCISSQFYPPHKHWAGCGQYSGSIRVLSEDGGEPLHEYEVEADTLDELQEIAQSHVAEILGKIHNAIKSALSAPATTIHINKG